jgi:hypothetical protein
MATDPICGMEVDENRAKYEKAGTRVRIFISVPLDARKK